jgi:hypothetical protein
MRGPIKTPGQSPGPWVLTCSRSARHENDGDLPPLANGSARGESLAIFPPLALILSSVSPLSFFPVWTTTFPFVTRGICRTVDHHTHQSLRSKKQSAPVIIYAYHHHLGSFLRACGRQTTAVYSGQGADIVMRSSSFPIPLTAKCGRTRLRRSFCIHVLDLSVRAG